MARVLVLTAITGSQIGQRLTIEGRSVTIGSGSRTDLQLNDRAIEARHAELKQVLDRWFITPLTASGFGVSVNGMPISGQSRINPGDTVTLGSVTYRTGVEDIREQEAGASGARSGVPRLGEYFLRRGVMTSDQLERVAQRQSELNRSGSQLAFGQIAFEMGYVNRSQLESALSEQREDFFERFSG